jgi:hypothetical protein
VLHVLWEPPIDTGLSAITSYELALETASGWVTQVGGTTGSYLGAAYSVASTLISGQTYVVKVRAYNMWGWGTYSPTLDIQAAAIPA